ncbi:uncharacterized protein LOC119839381 [Zerene cesonia]|uniref:uncharacterized protein LOC119839381 n=1 Tax=Zerene cesonia TaxID=33412 RepID=UPI0018E51425|nr:uncharacterized protein LOC119839381 [Zerene cesonia]
MASYDYEDLEYKKDYEDYLDDDAEEPPPRVRRYPTLFSSKKTPLDIRDVRDAVNQLLATIDEGSPTRFTGGRLATRLPLFEDMEYTDHAEMLPAPQPVLYDYIMKPTRSTAVGWLRAAAKTTTTAPEPTNATSAANTTTTVSTLPTARWPIDVPALLDLIAVLAADYETNLTRKLNESLMQMSIPTCETFTPLKVTTSEYDANATGTVIAKCFVCGLEEEGVPHSAPCADAFAGDFLPLVPVDPTARAKISKYRKYCKYLNIKGYMYNDTQPRAIFGRWTGGCGVRWIDLSGIYTQRTCRSRFQATMGKHYASKRMARLEMALLTLDNGCIVSPMATLVPLSRGVSLFARFHACVCTGSWCNTAIQNAPWTSIIFLLLLLTRRL